MGVYEDVRGDVYLVHSERTVCSPHIHGGAPYTQAHFSPTRKAGDYPGRRATEILQF